MFFCKKAGERQSTGFFISAIRLNARQNASYFPPCTRAFCGKFNVR